MSENELVEQYDKQAEDKIERILQNKTGGSDETTNRRNSKAINYKFTPEQLEVVKEFNRFKELRSVKPWTRYSYVVWCRQFCAFVGKEFDKITSRDAEDYLLSLRDKGEVTQFRHRIYLKFFFTWFYEDYLKQAIPDWVRKIPRNKPRVKRSPQELLTKDELQRLFDAARHPMHQTILRLLAESGLRRKELLSLRVGDIAFEGSLTVLWANGKTGEGAVYLYEATPYLMSWLRAHPFRNDPTAPLFYSIDKETKKPRSLSISTPNFLIKELAKRAGIDTKRVYCHLFRFTAATHDAVNMTDAVMRLKYRWSSYSSMPAHYASLHGEALKDQVKRQYGILPKEEEKAKPIECPTCHFVNLPGERFCTNCYRGITLDAVQEVEERRKVFDAVQLLTFKRKKQVSIEDIADTIHEIEGRFPARTTA